MASITLMLARLRSNRIESDSALTTKTWRKSTEASYKTLSLSDFTYDLPEEAIAQIPLSERDASKLLVRCTDGAIVHDQFLNLDQYLPEGSLIVRNDSKVIPARLIGHLENAKKCEIFLTEPILSNSSNTWRAIGKPMKAFKEGTEIFFSQSIKGVITRESDHHGQGPSPCEITFHGDHDFEEWLEKNAYMPLPPYISRPDAQPAHVSPDRDRYQTIYAQHKGSVAAPTAGLHFTNQVMQSLSRKNISVCNITLHVGGGTFLPVKTECLDEHPMHKERFSISHDSFQKIHHAKLEKRPIVAVGTTSFRCLESFWQSHSEVNQWHETDIFIRPRHALDLYKPLVASGLITNFHQPCSTLFMLISALIGLDQAKSLYHSALQNQYRFLSYGDTSLLWLRH